MTQTKLNRDYFNSVSRAIRLDEAAFTDYLCRKKSDEFIFHLHKYIMSHAIEKMNAYMARQMFTSYGPTTIASSSLDQQYMFDIDEMLDIFELMPLENRDRMTIWFVEVLKILSPARKMRKGKE